MYPQGSVLGPLLFLIYITDLPDESPSQVRLFADDTALYLTIESEDHGSTLQNDFDLLSRWEIRWDMEFNRSKCQVVHVSGSKMPIKRDYMLHGQILESVTCAKYLGVDISGSLSCTGKFWKGTSRQRSGKGAIRKKIPTPKTEVEKNQTNNQVLIP